VVKQREAAGLTQKRSIASFGHFETFLNTSVLIKVYQDGDVKKYSGGIYSDGFYHALFCNCHCHLWRNYDEEIFWTGCGFRWSLVAFCKF
jgi:hypothetical protein